MAAARLPARLDSSSLTRVAEQPLHRALGLSDGEFDRICELLEREPNHFELAVFSLLWSEHCAYKHSALLLRRFPTTGERVLQGPGENAGVVDLGEGEAVAFKVESHNHPSAVEPFQGAATGVGGILRDIVAMGARPVALLDGLRFGQPGWQFERAVEGVAHYGNCVGVPTVGGDTVFDVAYEDNCLVNAMCVGLLPRERLTRAAASGVGNVIALYGATTGRDGIGGASVLASQELGEGAQEKRPSVQIGDPFTGKKLIEVSVELTERGLVESLQDLGAAGLASSLAEMARGGRGIDVQLDRVPLREAELEPWEIMISESQERMVAVVRPENTAAVEEVCRRWELEFAVIGEVTDSAQLRAVHEGEIVGEIPARLLTDEAPRYRLEVEPRAEAQPAPPPPVASTREALLELLASPNVRSRAWIYRRYDHLVGSRTVRRPGLDAAVLRLKPSFRGLAVSLDGTGRIGRLDPRSGGALAVLEAARNVACAGGEPLACTDCLNFGNPEKPEIAWELAEAIEGMAEACEALGLPVVSGNVSLYNETDGRAIDPTPTVGCVGLVADVREIPGRWREGDAIFLAGDPELTLDGSELQALHGRPATLDLPAEAALVDFLWRNASRLTLAHDASEGGLAVALAEAAIWSGIGADLELPDDLRALFGEGGGQAVVACAAADADSLSGVPLRRIGTVTGTTVLGVPVNELRAAWEDN
jgi:phosphoribosylformylglycinamidine synthase subunit PurL